MHWQNILCLGNFSSINEVICHQSNDQPFFLGLQEEAVQYVANTVSKLLKEQQEQGLKRIYVISTYVIGKERLLVAVHKSTGCKIGVTQQKLDIMKCLDLPGNAGSLLF